MSESRSHIDLVSIAYEYIKTLVPLDKHVLIEIDSSDTRRPTNISGRYIPDVQFWDDDIYIIGEAKTINDFDREHSRKQFEAYISECSSFYGNSYLVISVPWQLVITAKNYFIRQKTAKNFKFQIIILNELGDKIII